MKHSLNPAQRQAGASPLKVRVAGPPEKERFDAQMGQHHYLGAGQAVGDYLRQIVEADGCPVALLVCAGAWMGYYDLKAFGKATTLPYTINRATYAVVPYYFWQHPRPAPVYRSDDMRIFYEKEEMDFYNKIHSRCCFTPGRRCCLR